LELELKLYLSIFADIFEKYLLPTASFGSTEKTFDLVHIIGFYDTPRPYSLTLKSFI